MHEDECQSNVSIMHSINRRVYIAIADKNNFSSLAARKQGSCVGSAL